jgi:hypothetical protein
MSTRLQASVDSFSVIDGVWQEKSTSIGIFEEASVIPDKRGRGNLYVLVETVGAFPEPTRIQQEIVRIIEEYYRTPGSITASIREAIKTANTYLFEENLQAPREERGVAGVTCVVLKDRDAYVGQCGPTVLYQVGGGDASSRDENQLRRLPSESTWLSSKTLQEVDISREPPLGLRRDIEPDLHHLHIEEGDVLILASASLAKLASNEEIAGASLQRGAHTVRENLEELAQGRDLSLIVVEALGAEHAPTSEEGEAYPAAAGEFAGERPGLWGKASSAVRRLSRPSSRDQEDRLEEELGEEPAETERVPIGVQVQHVAQSARRGLGKLTRGLATLLVRVLPEREESKRARQARPSRQGTGTAMDKRWLWAVLLVPLVIVLLIALTRVQHERSQQAQYRQLLAQVQEAKVSAQAMTTVPEQRSKLTEALSLVEQAAQIKPADQDLLAEKQSISDWLDRINRVVRLTYLGPLQDFSDADGKAQVTRVIVHGLDVYVLDRGTQRVYKHLLNESRDALQPLTGDPVLLREGDQQGEITIDSLLDIAWVEAGGFRGSGRLFILDKQGHVLQYDPLLGMESFPTAETGSWLEPIAASGYYGRLYVLDPRTTRVLRYVLTNSGYEASSGDYFIAGTDSKISNAVDLCIDGNMYILHADGMISKYQEGTGVPFTQSNLDVPLKNPSSIAASGFMDEGGYVYVADAGNQRVVQFSKSGEFIRQLRSSDATNMNDLRNIFVDEAAQKLFLLNGNKLYVVQLPQ